MKTTITLNFRIFPVVVQGRGDERLDKLVLTKQQLQAAQLVGQSSKELIHHRFNRQGYKVQGIGKPEKQGITINLEELPKAHTLHQLGKREGWKLD